LLLSPFKGALNEPVRRQISVFLMIPEA